jgi:uncharacterized membrane protein HdeD (DUF308 family)
MDYERYLIFVRMIGAMSIFAGLLIVSTPFLFPATSQTWYVVPAYFFGACAMASGVILFITGKMERVKWRG